ncbi:MAG: heavy-metal-associated domain-containing protein [Eggerthellaceae bacterium]
MTKVTVYIEGMVCSMCEAHIADTMRKAFPDARKVNASHRKGMVTFLTEMPVDGDQLKHAIAPTGYGYQGYETEPAKTRRWAHRTK